jgi:hypothetical protein
LSVVEPAEDLGEELLAAGLAVGGGVVVLGLEGGLEVEQDINAPMLAINGTDDIHVPQQYT